MFDIFDKDHSDTIELRELISGLSFLCKGDLNEKMKFVFNLFDSDNNGYLDKEEVKAMHVYMKNSVSRMHFLQSTLANSNRKKKVNLGRPPISTQKALRAQKSMAVMQKPVEYFVRDIFASADIDDDGSISFEEYKKWVQKSAKAKDFLTGLETLTDYLVQQEHIPIGYVHHAADNL